MTPVKFHPFLVLTFLFCATACSNSHPIDHRPMSPEEIAVPKGRYQDGVDMNHTCRVDLPVPVAEPTVAWSISLTPLNDYTGILVDGHGGTWYNNSPSGGSLSRIVKLAQDGSTEFSMNIVSNGPVIPVLALEEGMIVQVVSRNELYLLCFDTSGAERWKSDSMELGRGLSNLTMRVSETELAVSYSPTDIQFLDIATGEFTSSIIIPGRSIGAAPMLLPLANGEWILPGGGEDTNGDNYYHLSRLTETGAVIWSHTFPGNTWSMPVSITPNGYIGRPSRSGFSIFDSDSGTELHSLWSDTNYVCGVTPDNHFIVSGRDYKFDTDSIRSVSTDGRVTWSVDAWSDGRNGVVIYSDGSVLAAHSEGVILISSTGQVQWNIDPQKFGFSSGRFGVYPSVNPLPDGGFMLFARDGDDVSNGGIFCLQPLDK